MSAPFVGNGPRTPIDALSKTIDSAAVGGDAWRYFARFSAQRDIGGQDARVTGSSGAPSAGVYRSFGGTDAGEPESFFRRAARLWGQYHDTGRMDISGADVGANSVTMQLVGFTIPLDGFVRLQGYYLEEYGRLVGLAVTSTVKRSTARGDPFCEWEHCLGRTPASQAYVASVLASRV